MMNATACDMVVFERTVGLSLCLIGSPLFLCRWGTWWRWPKSTWTANGRGNAKASAATFPSRMSNCWTSTMPRTSSAESGPPGLYLDTSGRPFLAPPPLPTFASFYVLSPLHLTAPAFICTKYSFRESLRTKLALTRLVMHIPSISSLLRRHSYPAHPPPALTYWQTKFSHLQWNRYKVTRPSVD